MGLPLFTIDPLPWWRSRRALGAALVVAGTLAGAVATLSDGSRLPPLHEPVVVRVAPSAANAAATASPFLPSPMPHAAQPLPAPAAAAAIPVGSAAPQMPVPPVLSRQIAPGVHITPLSVPPGTTPEPAGPHAGDSEPEN